MDIFLFPVTTLNNFLCHTCPNIQPYPSTRWTGQILLVELPPIPTHSPPIPWRFSGRQVTTLNAQASNSPLPMNPTLTDLHTSSRRDSPLTLYSPPTHTSSTFPAPSISLVLRRSQPTSPSHNLVIPLPIVSRCQFRCKKIELIKLLRGFKPGLQRWELAVLTTMLPCMLVLKIPESTYWYQPNPGVTLDTFLFPDTTPNNFLSPTMPLH